MIFLARTNLNCSCLWFPPGNAVHPGHVTKAHSVEALANSQKRTAIYAFRFRIIPLHFCILPPLFADGRFQEANSWRGAYQLFVSVFEI